MVTTPLFGRDVEPLELSVVGENVGVFADRGHHALAHRRQINDGEARVAFACNKRKPHAFFEIEAVRAAASTESGSAGDGSVHGIDAHQFLWWAHGSEDGPVPRVVGDVSGLAGQLDRLDRLSGAGVERGDRSGVLVRDEDACVGGIVRKAVGKVTGWDSEARLERGGVDGDDLVGAGGRGVDDAEIRRGADAVHIGNVIDGADPSAPVDVDDVELARTQMRDEDPASRGVEILVVEA
jgi:hypothetical protein